MKQKELTNQHVSDLLEAVAAAYVLKGEDFFRIRAYENAAEGVQHATREIKDIWEDGKLDEIPGIGANIASHLDELLKTGKVRHFNQVLKDFPPSVFEFIKVPGIGPKNALKLAKGLKINVPKKAIENLKKAANEGKVRLLESFGTDSEKSIIESIHEYERRENRMLLTEAQVIADELINYLKQIPEVQKVESLGSLRRKNPTVGDIDCAVSSINEKEVMKMFVAFPRKKRILAKGTNTARIMTDSGRQIDCKVVKPTQFGSLLQHFTGSKNHNIALREFALKKGCSLSEYGIKKGRKMYSFSDENKFYQYLGLDWIPPELRENRGEIVAASKHELPTLVKTSDIKGDLHTHANLGWISSHDSGVNSDEQMINKALELKYEYLGLGDHNPSLGSYSKKQIINLVKIRVDQINNINLTREKSENKNNIKIFSCLEVDILANGDRAIPDIALEMLDYAIVSIHSSFRMGKKQMTQRIINGLSHPKVKLLGHPTGRLINKREGYEIDWDKLFDFCRNNGKFLEINAWPTRLDLPDTIVKDAIENRVKLVINTDAHAVDHLELMTYGVSVARRGWAEIKNIMNTLSKKEVEKLLTQNT